METYIYININMYIYYYFICVFSSRVWWRGWAASPWWAPPTTWCPPSTPTPRAPTLTSGRCARWPRWGSGASPLWCSSPPRPSSINWSLSVRSIYFELCSQMGSWESWFILTLSLSSPRINCALFCLSAVAMVNILACKGLDRIEKTLPILHQPPEQVGTFSGASRLLPWCDHQMSVHLCRTCLHNILALPSVARLSPVPRMW